MLWLHEKCIPCFLMTVLPPGPSPTRVAWWCCLQRQACTRAARAALSISLCRSTSQIGKNVMAWRLTSRFISSYYFIHRSVHTHTAEFWRLDLKKATALICTKSGSAKSDCLRMWENILVSHSGRTSSFFHKDDYYCFWWWTAKKSNY